MVALEKALTILREVREYIIPLGEEELFQLERNLLTEGCREPLIVWPKDNQLIMVDGHNRYKICQKHNIPFRTRKVHFKDIDEVKLWMVDNQMGRRNLTQDQLSYYRGLKYITLKKKKGGYEYIKSKGKNQRLTSEVLSSQFNVSESTIKRDAKFAQGLDNISRSNPKLKLKILTGEAKVKKADVQTLSAAKNLVIKNEADLYNKAKRLREDTLNELEDKIKRIEKNKIDEVQVIRESREPIFLEKGDRLKRIKGMVLSAVNRAIDERDEDAIKELKKLIDQLEDLLF